VGVGEAMPEPSSSTTLSGEFYAVDDSAFLDTECPIDLPSKAVCASPVEICTEPAPTTVQSLPEEVMLCSPGIRRRHAAEDHLLSKSAEFFPQRVRRTMDASPSLNTLTSVSFDSKPDSWSEEIFAPTKRKPRPFRGAHMFASIESAFPHVFVDVERCNETRRHAVAVIEGEFVNFREADLSSLDEAVRLYASKSLDEFFPPEITQAYYTFWESSWAGVYLHAAQNRVLAQRNFEFCAALSFFASRRGIRTVLLRNALISTYVLCVDIEEVGKFAAYKAELETLVLICLYSLTWSQRRKQMLSLLVRKESFWRRAKFSLEHSRVSAVVGRMKDAAFASRRRSVQVTDEDIFVPVSPTLTPTSQFDPKSPRSPKSPKRSSKI
jgi:hypothetical protein